MIQPTDWMVWLSEVAASHFESALSTAVMIGSLFLWLQAVGQFLAAWQRHFSQKSAGPAVPKRRILEECVIADLERTLVPARARQNPLRGHFEHPGFGRLAVLGVGLDHERDVGVGPVDLLDGGFHGLLVFKIVGGVGMVRRHGTCEAQHQRSSENNDPPRHLGSSLFDCVDRSIGLLRVRDEYVVAELVFSRDQILLLAFAFGDFIVAIGIAAEISRRFPGGGENLWRRDSISSESTFGAVKCSRSTICMSPLL